MIFGRFGHFQILCPEPLLTIWEIQSLYSGQQTDWNADMTLPDLLTDFKMVWHIIGEKNDQAGVQSFIYLFKT
jgi:hypothetical protein